MKPSISSRLVAPGILLLASVACSDGGTGPGARELSLEIRRSGISAEEETIPVGGTLRLGAAVERPSGEEVQPTPRVRWTSTAPAVATVDSAGVVTGMQLGTALIVANVDRAVDTVRINVANPVAGAITCGAGDALGITRVGEVVTTTADQAVTTCIAGGPAGSEFTLIAFNASEVPESRLAVEFSALGTRAAQGPPVPELAAARSLSPRLVRDLAFHEELRERSSGMFASRLSSGGALAPSSPRLAAVPAIGDLLPLNVSTAGNGCANPDVRTGRVMAVTRRAIVVADTANPQTTRPEEVLTPEDFEFFGQTFDTLVWNVDTRNFGEPTDIDNNDRVIIFFTRAVNELTATGSSSYIAGFFFNRDLFPARGQNACEGSNAGEIVYMMVPDPRGTVNRNARSRAFVTSTTVGVLAHEFQHLINDSRRLYVTRAPVWEETWLNEGLSHIAEELVFYAATGLAPERNIGWTEMQNPRVQASFNLYNRENVERLIQFLDEPQAASLLQGDDLATRGAVWSFLRYAADRVPGADEGLWKELVNSRGQGLANLQRVLGVNPRDWMNDWAISLYTDDAGFEVDAKYRQPSWNLRALIPTLRSELGFILRPRYPLNTLPLVSGTRRTVSLQGGGAAYFRFGIGPDQTAGVRALAGGLPAPSRLRITIVRTK